MPDGGSLTSIVALCSRENDTLRVPEAYEIVPAATWTLSATGSLPDSSEAEK
ncbi:hypothetical protein D3C83_242680 [compost metagenome]